MKYTQKEAINENGLIFDLSSLYAHLEKLTDKRKARGKRYSLVSILVLIVLAKLGGEDKPSGIADWVTYRKEILVEALKLSRKRVPHHSTYRRILADVLDIEQLEQVLADFQAGCASGKHVLITMDGKTMRGTIEPGQAQGLHLLAAYVPEEGVVLMEMRGDKKENEIVVAPQVLGCLDLRDKVVVADAMQTQRKLSVQIGEAGGDYIWFVKDNQPYLRQDIQQLFAQQKTKPGFNIGPRDFETEKSVHKRHGRLEVRTLTTSGMLNDFQDWPHLEQVFKLQRNTTYLKTGKQTQEVVYGITSLSASKAKPKRLIELTSAYWSIENSLHYRRDVTFREDHTRFTKPRAAQAMAAINNLVITLLLRQGYKNTARARRKYAAKPILALNLILAS